MTLVKPATKIGRKYQNPIETEMAGFRMMFKVLWLHIINREERTPKKLIGPFRTDVAIYQQPPASGLRITWLGHSSMLVEIDGSRILVDPMWDGRASPKSWIGPKRFFAPPLPLEQLPKLNAVLLSHDHFDHLGAQTIRRLSQLQSPRFICPLGLARNLKVFGVAASQITELDWTQSTTLDKLSITALPSRHFSGRGVTDRFETLWASYVLKGDKHNIYYGADSGMWPGFADIGSQYGPFHLTMLEIGAYHHLWKDIHMGPEGAAKAFSDLGSNGLLMPIHWGLFDLALHGWRQPIQRMNELALQHAIPLWSPEPGRPTEVIAGQPHQSDWWLP